MHTDSSARHFVRITLGEHENDHNVDAIADELHRTYDTWDFDSGSIPGGEYWKVVEKHRI